MSAFLGPVHQWMYGKIQLQETLTARLVEHSADPALARRLEEAYGPADTQPLEDIIDQRSIHGWLDGRVQRAENRFADAVEALLAQGAMDRLTDTARALGRAHAVAGDADPSAAYQVMDSVLLDGMPCDGGRQVVSEDGDGLTFQFSPGLHALCRRGEAEEGAFMALREALVGGMLEGSGLRLDPLGQGTYRLVKEG